jgi:Fe-S oxidoreductase/nitrate reductase gamma subunit
MDSARELMWNVPAIHLMYWALAATGVVFLFGMVRRIHAWRCGRPHIEGLRPFGLRLWFLVREVFGQRKIFRVRRPAWLHGLIFFGFLILLATTIAIGSDAHFGTRFFLGSAYRWWSLLADLAGLSCLVGIGLAFWRRGVQKPISLETRPVHYLMLVWLALIVLSGFLVQGTRMAAIGDPLVAFSPIGRLTASGLSMFSVEGLRQLHAVAWWGHTLIAFAWLALLPFTPFVHLILVPLNAFFGKTRPPGALARVDLEALLAADDGDLADFRIGLTTTGDLSWKQRLDLDACLDCGRCQDVCPAFAAGQSLSPRRFVAGLRRTVRSEAVPARQSSPDETAIEIVGQAFDPDFLWQCRTCRACDEVCPAHIDHVDTHIELRRGEVGMKGRMPGELEQMLRSLETHQNPFGAQSERIRWTETLGVPVIGPGDRCDVLYWMGCLSTFDPTQRVIAQDLIGYLTKAGVNVGVLGEGELCCGDPARVAGEENLFQTIARRQVAELQRRHFQTLLVSCPHCLNVLKNEYPTFDGRFNVVHHSQLLHYLMPNSIASPHKAGRGVFYHDPCYLGRYQGLYQPARNVLESGSGYRLAETRASKRDSFCCGAGGGHFWIDSRQGERPGVLRVRQAVASGAELIATACPYCRQMLEDAVKELHLSDRMQVVDIVSLIVERPEDGK